MARDLPRTDLDRPAGEVCRRLVLDHLELADAARGRLTDPDPDDGEALHDFRVALRRLRGTLRAFPEPLAGALGKKWVRRLDDLAGRTGEGRDAEVALAWVVAQRPHLNWRQRRGLDWYAERLAERKERGYARALGGVSDRFEKLAGRLRRRLGTVAAEIHDGPLKTAPVEPRDSPADEPPELPPNELPGGSSEGARGGPPAATPAPEPEAGEAGRARAGQPPAAAGAAGATAARPPATDAEPTPDPAEPELDSGCVDSQPESAAERSPPFALILAAAARRCSTRLVNRLGELRAAGDEEPAHRARIAAKRLRYILEPTAAGAAEARKAVRALKRLQDLLGELHDAHVLERELAAAVERAAHERVEDLFAAAVEPAGVEPPTPAAGRWDVVAGLLALARRNRERRDKLFTQLAKGWLSGPKTANLAAAVGGLAARLEAQAVVGRASEPAAPQPAPAP